MRELPKSLLGYGLTAAAAFAVGWGLKSTPPAAPKAESHAAGTRIVSANTPAADSRIATSNESPTTASPAEQSAFAHFLSDGIIATAAIKDAMQMVDEEADPLKRAELFSELLTHLTPENAQAAFLAMRESRKGRRARSDDEDRMRLLANAWGRIDGENAIAALTKGGVDAKNERKGKKSKGRAYDAIMGWATVAPGDAIAYLDKLESPREKSAFGAGVVEGLLVDDVQGALNFVRGLSDSDRNRIQHMATIADRVLESGVSGAMTWVESLPDDLKAGAIERVASQFAREDLGAALDWIGKQADESYAKKAVARVAGRWAQDDPQAVIDWATDLPDQTQNGVVGRTLSEWTENDPIAASKYLASMPANEARDSAVHGFASNLAHEDPESAAIWAATISSEKLRAKALTDVARNWLQVDEAAAIEWLPSSGLSEKAMLAALQKSGKSGKTKDKKDRPRKNREASPRKRPYS